MKIWQKILNKLMFVKNFLPGIIASIFIDDLI